MLGDKFGSVDIVVIRRLAILHQHAVITIEFSKEGNRGYATIAADNRKDSCKPIAVPQT
ncbi:hypothetical protein D3C83_186460 [compost metagenome]